MKGKKLLALALCLLLALSLLPVSALADGNTGGDDGGDDGDEYVDVTINLGGDSGSGTGTGIFVAGSAEGAEAGSETAFFGTAWNATLPGNEMSLDSGVVYKKTYTVDRAYSNVQLKVVQNNNWYNEQGLGGDNITFQLSGPGSFTVYFNDSLKKAWVESDQMVYDDEPGAVYIAADREGTWEVTTDWNPAFLMMDHKEHNVWEKVVTFETAGSKYFKITEDGTWNMNYGGAFSRFGAAITGEWNSSQNIAFYANAGDTIKIRYDRRSNVTITVYRFCQVTVANDIVNGTLSAAPLSGYSGTRVTLTATPASGCQLNKYIVDGVETSTNNFLLGDHDVTVSASFMARQFTVSSITYSTNGVDGDSEGGSIRLSSPVNYMNQPQTAPVGSEFTFNVVRYRGYDMTLTALDENGEPVEMSLRSSTENEAQGSTTCVYYLNIPSSDVTVHAEFTGQREYHILMSPSLYGAGDSLPHTMSEDEQLATIANLSVVPEYAQAGTIVTVTVVPKTGYFIKHSMNSYDHFNNTLTQTGDYTFTFEVPDYAAQYSSVRVIKLSTALAIGLDEGRYVQVGEDAPQTQWIRLSNDYPFFGGVSSVWHGKATLSAGQRLTAYEVSNPGDDPVQKTAINAAGSGTQTIYYVAEGTGELYVSDLTGYYIVRADMGSTRPYDITADLQLTENLGVYTFDGIFRGGSWVCVAEYAEGTVVETYPCVNDVNTRFVTKREAEGEPPYDGPDENEYDGTGPECFPYFGAKGRAWFLPDGSGDAAYASGYLKIQRLYSISVDSEQTQNCYVVGDVNVDKPAGETAVFETKPHNGTYRYKITSVTAVDGAGTPLSVTIDEIGTDMYRCSFLMPASNAVIAVITERIVSHDITYLPGEGSGDPRIETADDGRSCTLPNCSFTAPTGKVFKAWSVAIGGAAPVLMAPGEEFIVTDDTVVTATWLDVAVILSATASFDESLRLSFYVNIPDELLTGAYAELTCNGDIQTIHVTSSLYEDNGPGKVGYRFSCLLVAKQIEDEVNLRLFAANGDPLPFVNATGTYNYTDTGVTYSLLRYIQYWINQPETSENKAMRAVALAAKDYCYAAKRHFDYNVSAGTYDPAATLTSEQVTELNGFVSKSEGTLPAGVSVDFITAMFESDNSFRLYLAFAGKDPDADFTYQVDGANAQLHTRTTDGKRYLTFTGVLSNKLHKPHVITISDGTNSYSLTVSVLTYARAIQNSSTAKATMKTLARALYLYSKASVAKFGEN